MDQKTRGYKILQAALATENQPQDEENRMEFQSVFARIKSGEKSDYNPSDYDSDNYTLLDISNCVVSEINAFSHNSANVANNISQNDIDPADRPTERFVPLQSATDPPRPTERFVCNDNDDVQEHQQENKNPRASRSYLKKVANKTSMKRKATRDARLKGKAYIGYKKMRDGSISHSVEKSARSLGGRCSHNDKEARSSRSFMCGLVTQDDRDHIFTKFWDLKSWEAKKAMIRGLVATRQSIRRRAETATEKNKELMHDCFLPVSTGKVRVCKKIFISTLGISNDQFRRWTSDDLSTSGSFIDEDSTATDTVSHQNDEQNKTPSEKISKANDHKKSRESVKRWLEKLPKVPSHYCRSSTKKTYVESTFRSIMHMYSVYKDYIENESITVQPVSRQVFSSILKQSNISIHMPRKDQCDFCCMHEIGTINEESYQNHIMRKDLCRNAKNEAKLSSSDSHVVITVDLQSVLLSPRLQASSAYYKLKLQVHNFTIYRLNDGDVHLYVWHEGNGGVTANEFATCITDYIGKLPPKVEKITIVSDGCGYQNRNKTLSNTLHHYCVENSIIIEQIYLEKGHTMMEADSVHSTLERMFCGAIYSPSDYLALMRAARPKQPYCVHNVDYGFFKNFEKLDKSFRSIRPGCRAGDAVVNDLRHLRYEKDGRILYKLIATDEWEEIPNKKRKCNRQNESNFENIPSLYSEPLKISVDKFNHLQDLKKLIPSEYHSFYENLHH